MSSDTIWGWTRMQWRSMDCDRVTTPNKITGANAGGRRRLPMRTRWAARVAQFGEIMTPSEIDDAILASCDVRWLKVAMVVGAAPKRLGAGVADTGINQQVLSRI